MQLKQIEELGVKTNGLLYSLQDSVNAYGFEPEDCGPKTVYKISYKFGLSHPNIK